MAFVFALAHYTLLFNSVFNLNFDALIKGNELSGYGITLGFIPFIVMLVLTLTSSDWAMKKLGSWWGKLHWLTYPAFFFVVAHAVKIGIDFQKGLNLYSASFLVIALITVALRLIVWYQSKAKTKTVAKTS